MTEETFHFLLSYINVWLYNIWGHSITMLTREGGWVVCEMSTKVNKRWVHGSFMVNVDFQRIAHSLFK